MNKTTITGRTPSKPALQDIGPPRTEIGGRMREIWRPRSLPARAEFFGPLQQIVIPVVGKNGESSGGWSVVAQEQRSPSGNVWKISSIHANDGWQGEELPIHGAQGFVPCNVALNATVRDAVIADKARLIMRPLYAPGEVCRRDFTCPHCHLTERDATEDGVCIFCRKPKAKGWNRA